ncbi:MAG: glutamate-5-semialdehyde dehydrogenase [Rhodospirillales bacterium]|nr:glutamate-5-semialdehyde dehydrogenase [Rhodospirillales bacterium]
MTARSARKTPARSGKASIALLMEGIGRAARAAAAQLAETPAATKTAALNAAAEALIAARADILAANARDFDAARRGGMSKAMLDRLMLDDGRIDAMAKGIAEVAALPDPVGEVIADWTRPNGLRIQRVRVPIGVIGVIFESRPNVAADAGALCLKAGNACILRGGSDSLQSVGAIVAALRRGLARAKVPEAAIQMVPVADRAAVGKMLTMTEFIDVIVPRGGKSLIERVTAESRVPLFKHLEGLCHTYVDGAADPAKARAIVLNAKMRRTGICGATETLLVDRAKFRELLPPILGDLIAAGCEVRGDADARALDPRVKPATEKDWDTEYLDAIISVRVVDGVAGAIEHIRAHGSNHTDAIVTEDAATAETFLKKVDSAIVLVNASTQFADGGEFGMGAEIGISTDKLHARGPVGVEQLTSFKYVVRGTGQCRA